MSPNLTDTVVIVSEIEDVAVPIGYALLLNRVLLRGKVDIKITGQIAFATPEM